MALTQEQINAFNQQLEAIKKQALQIQATANALPADTVIPNQLVQQVSQGTQQLQQFGQSAAQQQQQQPSTATLPRFQAPLAPLSPLTRQSVPAGGFVKVDGQYRVADASGVLVPVTDRNALIRLMLGNQPFQTLSKEGLSFADPSGSAEAQKAILSSLQGVDLNKISPDFNISKLSGAPKTLFDLQSLFEENRQRQSELISSFEKSPLESSLENQLLSVRESARNTQLSAQAGIQKAEDQPIPLSFVTGQSAQIAKQANLSLQTLASQERNLADRLGIEQQNRQLKLETVKSLINFNNQNFQSALQFRQQIVAEEDRALARVQALDQNAKETLFKLVSGLQGVDFNDLSPQAQLQISQLAAQAGVPIDLLSAGLSVSKNQQLLDDLEKRTRITLQNAQISQINQVASGLSESDQKQIDSFLKNETLQDLQVRADAFNTIKSVIPKSVDQLTNISQIDSSALHTLSLQFARLQNPKVSRLADAGSTTNANSLKGIAEQYFNAFSAGTPAALSEVKGVLTNAESIYNANYKTGVLARDTFKGFVSDPSAIDKMFNILNAGRTSSDTGSTPNLTNKITVSAGGINYEFDTQEQADLFKKAAGL